MGTAFSEEAKEARRAYNRDYYWKNREKMLDKQRKYWERKGKELQKTKRA